MFVKFDIVDDKPCIIAEDHVLEAIRHEFSIENAAKSFTTGYKKKFIPSRLYAIAATGKFEIGLTHDILRTIAAKQLASNVELTDKFKRKLQPTINTSVYDDLTHELRYYQKEGVEKALHNGRGICQLATGAGKTLIIASLAASAYAKFENFRCLILVPDPGLALQTFNDFKNYQVPFKTCLWTGTNELDLSANVIIANQRIVLTRAEENEWIEYVDVLIVDEVHTIKKDNKINKIISKIKTNHRFGFTGTLPTHAVDRWNVLGAFGDVVIIKSSAELRSEGFLTNVEAKILSIAYKSKVQKPIATHNDKGKKISTAKYKAELDFIYHNEYRNNILQQLCCNFNNNILVLINHLDHGETLVKTLQACTTKQVFYVHGDVELQDRETIKQMMEKHNDVIVIAMSKIFSTGISINNIHMIVFAAGGKSFVRVVQSIGRGLRLHESKDRLIIIDVLDQLPYASEHAQQRQTIYNSEKIKYSIIPFVEK